MNQELNENTEITEKTGFNKIHRKVIAAAYRYCRAVAKNHYENFPVASLILPKKTRPAIEAIYAFARMADDFADEQEFEGCRLKKLDEWQMALHDNTRPTHPVFISLQDTIKTYNLPVTLFEDLLSAFRMDVNRNSYKNFDELLYYCHHSANPVGRLILHLFKQDSESSLKRSDLICTALQLANFWQDVAIDLKKNRIYIPLEDMDRFNLTVQELHQQRCTDSFKRLLSFQIERTREIFLKGKRLGLSLHGLLGIEIRLTWLTGMTILNKIVAVNYDVFNRRPVLSKIDFLKSLFIACSKKRYERYLLQ